MWLQPAFSYIWFGSIIDVKLNNLLLVRNNATNFLLLYIFILCVNCIDYRFLLDFMYEIKAATSKGTDHMMFTFILWIFCCCRTATSFWYKDTVRGHSKWVIGRSIDSLTRVKPLIEPGHLLVTGVLGLAFVKQWVIVRQTQQWRKNLIILLVTISSYSSPGWIVEEM